MEPSNPLLVWGSDPGSSFIGYQTDVIDPHANPDSNHYYYDYYYFSITLVLILEELTAQEVE